MCVIIHRPLNVKLDKQIYENCFDNNDDGAGFCLVDDGQLIVSKGFMNFEEFYDALRQYDGYEAIIHFRIASPGMAVTKEMCHPFVCDTGENTDHQVDDNGKLVPGFQFAIAHNGRLPWRSNNLESDTHCFVKDVLGPHLAHDPHFLEVPSGFTLLEGLVTDRNKLAIMRYDLAKDEVTSYIVNEKAGHNIHGCWFSNYSYIARFDDVEYGEMWPHYAQHRRTFHYPPTTYEIEAFTKPDKDGWAWSYEMDGWYQASTKKLVFTLAGRVTPTWAIKDEWKRRKRARDEQIIRDIEEQTSTVKAVVSSFSTEFFRKELGHMSKNDRALLCPIAIAWLKHSKPNDALNIVAAIRCLRDDVRRIYTYLKKDSEIYDWVIINKTAGKDVVKMLQEEESRVKMVRGVLDQGKGLVRSASDVLASIVVPRAHLAIGPHEDHHSAHPFVH